MRREFALTAALLAPGRMTGSINGTGVQTLFRPDEPFIAAKSIFTHVAVEHDGRS